MDERKLGPDCMKILVAVTYYAPYISGLTIYAERIAKAWADAGHQVTVLTSQHDSSLPLEEVVEGVKVVRAPILMRISKGGLMPRFWQKTAQLVKESDVVNIHLPQFDAAWVAHRAHVAGVFSVLTYHCDLQMPSGFVNQIANRVVLKMNDLAGSYCDAIVAYTKDYAEYSLFLPKFREKVNIIQPPVSLPDVSSSEVEGFQGKVNPEKKNPIIGMACRFAADKGVEVLLDALPKILAVYPNACVFFAGPYDNVLGERAYYEKLKPRLDELIAKGQWRFLGSLNPTEMTKFYRTIDLLTMPSLNRTDSFGLVQIEAMMQGKPCVSANLPGIRVPVTRHEMGEIIEIGNADDLAEKIIKVLKENRDYSDKKETIRSFYQPAVVAEAYEKMFEKYGVNG
ncbi:MAG: glycosyltransferase family 4 protein [Chloroflexi bacterium]|nr:glycosyltransferase family 4 protein [Chloroflexota bacterium]